MYKDNFIVALCMDGNVYIIAKGHGKREPKVLECNHPNEFFVDVTVTENRIIARSGTERLYISISSSRLDLLPDKLVEVDLGCALGLPNKPRILAMISYFESFACFVEDVGVVELRRNPYARAPEVDIVLRFSNSHKPGWDVVGMTWLGENLVIFLGNGLVYKLYPLKKTSLMEPQLLDFSEPIERVWGNNNRILALSRTKVLFQRDYYSNRGISHSSDHEVHQNFQQQIVQGIDGPHINSISMGQWHNIALMDDGTVYVWGSYHFRSTPEFVLGQYQLFALCKAVKIDVEHVVYVTSQGTTSMAIVGGPY